MDLFQSRVFAECGDLDAALQEELEFLPAWVGGGAAMATDSEGTTGIGVF